MARETKLDIGGLRKLRSEIDMFLKEHTGHPIVAARDIALLNNLSVLSDAITGRINRED